MKLTNMKAAQAEENQEYTDAPTPPEYPWGLQLHLSDEVLEALGYEDLAAFILGGSVKLEALARITGYSEHERSGGEKCMCLDLQITDLGLGKPMKPTVGGTLYPEGGE